MATSLTHLLHVRGDVNVTGIAHFADNVAVYNTNVVMRDVLPAANDTREVWIDTDGKLAARYWNGIACRNVTG